MTYKLTDKEFEAIRRLPIDKRYAHLIKRVGDWRELWSLRDGDEKWVLGVDDQGREFVPVWPHPRYAGASADGNWADSKPARISLKDWLAKWTPRLSKDRRLVTVFPTDEPIGAAIEPEAFAADLRQHVAENY